MMHVNCLRSLQTLMNMICHHLKGRDNQRYSFRFAVDKVQSQTELTKQQICICYKNFVGICKYFKDSLFIRHQEN